MFVLREPWKLIAIPQEQPKVLDGRETGIGPLRREVRRIATRFLTWCDHSEKARQSRRADDVFSETRIGRSL
jgi:hypothetical protein